MAHTAIAYPYAKALLDLSVELGELETNRHALGMIARAVDASADLRNVFSNPIISEEERRKVVVALAEQAKLTKTARNFLLIMAQKRRLVAFRDVYDRFAELADDHQGILRAEVRASAALSDDQKTRLKSTLSAKTGKQVELTTTIEPELMGGLRVKVGDTVYDATIATRLDQLRDAILNDI